MKKELDNPNYVEYHEQVAVDYDSLLIKDVSYKRIKTENIRSFEDVSAILEAMQLKLPESNPEFHKLKALGLI